MIMNVFNSEQEAIEAQALDFETYNQLHSDKPAEYWQITKRWAEVAKRADAEEWFYVAYSESSQTLSQKQDTESWYPQEEV